MKNKIKLPIWVAAIASITSMIFVQTVDASIETWETWSDSTDIPGNNGWVNFGFEGWAPDNATVSSGTGIGLSNGAASSGGGWEGGGNAIDLGDIVGGEYQFTALVNLGGSQLRLAVGDESVVNNALNANGYMLILDPGAGGNPIWVGNEGGGAREYDAQSVGVGGINNGWIQTLIAMHGVGTSTVTADMYYRDVDDTTGAALEAWNLIASLTSSSFDIDVTHFAFMVVGGSKVDNVGGLPIPEPASLALLGLGGLAMLSRRRR